MMLLRREWMVVEVVAMAGLTFSNSSLVAAYLMLSLHSCFLSFPISSCKFHTDLCFSIIPGLSGAEATMTCPGCGRSGLKVSTLIKVLNAEFFFNSSLLPSFLLIYIFFQSPFKCETTQLTKLTITAEHFQLVCIHNIINKDDFF